MSENDRTVNVAICIHEPFRGLRSTVQFVALPCEGSVQFKVTVFPEIEPLNTGAGNALTVIVCMVDAIAPASSVTRRRAVYVPETL